MLQIQRGELVACDPEIEQTLQSAHHALRFKTTNNNTIILVDKIEDEYQDPYQQIFHLYQL